MNDRDVDDFAQALQASHDERAVGPGTGQRYVQVVASGLGFESLKSILGYPVSEHRRFPSERAFNQDRINTGSMPLSADELTHRVSPSPLTRWSWERWGRLRRRAVSAS